MMVECKQVSIVSALVVSLVMLILLEQRVYRSYGTLPYERPLIHDPVNDRESTEPDLTGTPTHRFHEALKDSPQTLTESQQHIAGTSSRAAQGRLTQSDIYGVQYFVIFIGYAHSGHSIIGSMMDAHPNMVIAYEYGVIKLWLKDRKYRSDKKTLFNELCNKSRSTVAPNGWYDNQMKGYTLAIPNWWQGCQFTDLKVIGDKAGGMWVINFAKSSSSLKEGKKVFDEVRDVVGVPVKLIHVVRNPFDIIATTLMKPDRVGEHRWDETGANYTTTKQILSSWISKMKARAKVIMAVDEWGVDMLEIHHADFVHDPKTALQRICDFVDVDCSKEYLETCYNKSFTTISRSRYLMEWPPSVIAEGEAMMKEIPFFSRYSFDGE